MPSMTTIRTATHTDEPALDRLAQLDSGVVPAQPILIAEVDGAIVAALSFTIEHGRITRIFSVANPEKLERLDTESAIAR